MSLPRTIYLVEDHPITAEALTMLIESEPSLAVSGVASSAEEALATLADVPSDLVLVDMRLPGMSGIDLVARLRSERPTVRCLMMTAFEAERYAKAAHDAGAEGIVDKGDSDHLMDVIQRLLGSNGAS
jgi:DNA-binding NarL/FixJ family response regulator